MKGLLRRLPRRRLSCGILSLMFAAMSGGGVFAGPERALSLRILDAQTGKPIKKASASMVKWNEHGGVEVLSHGTTSAEGIIVFHLSEPLPDRIGFNFSPNELKYCSDLAFSTTEIINVGLLAQNKCQTDRTTFPSSRKAGEITLFAHKVPLSERMRTELP
jgi:hypothetical protein